MHKEEYERLLSHCLKTDIVEVEKYLIEEKISSERRLDIVNERGVNVMRATMKGGIK